jgi:hypothetical protein
LYKYFYIIVRATIGFKTPPGSVLDQQPTSS